MIEQSWLIHRWDHKRYNMLGQSWPGSNGNVGIFHNPKISWTGAAQSDSVYFHTEGISLVSALLPGWDTISVFKITPAGLPYFNW